MLRVILGLAKGAILGAGVGYGAFRLGLGGGWGYLVYAAVGLVVGLFVGRPLWSHLLDRKSTVWTSVLKGIFGALLGIGAFALVHAALRDPRVALQGAARPVTEWSFLFGAVVGGLYGAWVEFDDPLPGGEGK